MNQIFKFDVTQVTPEMKSLLEEKLAFQKEDLELELKCQDKTATKEDRQRMVYIRAIISQINTKLNILGFRKTRSDVEISDPLNVLLRMKDIVAENFGIETAKNLEIAAENRHKNPKDFTRFPLLRPEDEEILQRHSKWMAEKRHYAKLQTRIVELRTYLEGKIRSEADYKIRTVYSEIHRKLSEK